MISFICKKCKNRVLATGISFTSICVDCIDIKLTTSGKGVNIICKSQCSKCLFFTNDEDLVNVLCEHCLSKQEDSILEISEYLQKQESLFKGYANGSIGLKCLCDNLASRIFNRSKNE